MSHLNRRRFLQTTSAAGASLILTGTRASGAVNGANDRVRVAVAGLNGRGQSHIGGWMGQSNVELAYLCDPDANVLASRLKQVNDKAAGKDAIVKWYDTDHIFTGTDLPKIMAMLADFMKQSLNGKTD